MYLCAVYITVTAKFIIVINLIQLCENMYMRYIAFIYYNNKNYIL